MNSYRFALLALLLVGVAAGCQQKPAADGKAAAVVNGQTITDAELEQYIQLRTQHGATVDTADKKKLLDEMIDRVLLAQDAKKQGVDKDPEVMGLLQRLRENILVQSLVRKELKDHPITEAELKKRFETESAATNKTEYLVRHILTKNEDEAKAIIKELKSKKADFATLARKKSIDVQSGKKGGSLGWVNEGMVGPALFAGITKVKKGTFSTEPVKSDFGWHVIEVEDTRQAKMPTFKEFMANPRASNSLRRKMQDERIEKMVKDLRAAAKIEIKTK